MAFENEMGFSGYLAIFLHLRFWQRHRTRPVIVYRSLLGLVLFGRVRTGFHPG